MLRRLCAPLALFVGRGLQISALMCALASNVQSHELQANRMTVVLRAETHLSLTYWVDYPEALRRALMPQMTLTEFAVTHSAMSIADFQKQVAKAQIKFSSQTRAALPDGQALTLAQWRWPEPARVQAMLQERAMQALTAPSAHTHAMPTEIHAEAVSTRKITAVNISAPAEFGRILMVSYKPQQTWLAPGAAPVLAKF
jgi:hypothetical protein